MKSEGLITGLPTLMAIYKTRLDAEGVNQALSKTGYPLTDVRVYHRLAGTDQVLDAATGQVASGQALTKEEISTRMREHLETVVLLHPSSEQAQAVRSVLSTLGDPVFLDEGGDDAANSPAAGPVSPPSS